jgi:hypothetical protein
LFISEFSLTFIIGIYMDNFFIFFIYFVYIYGKMQFFPFQSPGRHSCGHREKGVGARVVTYPNTLNHHQRRRSVSSAELTRLAAPLQMYSLAELMEATNDFAEAHRIGSGDACPPSVK